MLICCERGFFQLLEGEESDVRVLHARTENDLRHQQIYKLWDGPIAARSDGQWAMAFIDQKPPNAMPQAVHPSGFRRGLANALKDSTGKKLLLNLRD